MIGAMPTDSDDTRMHNMRKDIEGGFLLLSKSHRRLVIHRPQDVLSRATREPKRERPFVRRKAQIRVQRIRMDDRQVL